MKIASTSLGLVVAILLAGCQEPLPVRLNLCPAQGSTDEEIALFRRADFWVIEVWGIEDDDVAWRRQFSSRTALRVDLQEAIPSGREVRIVVQGFGPVGEDERALVAIGETDPFIPNELDKICLCMAAPARYEELCPDWSCVWSDSAGCWGGEPAP